MFCQAKILDKIIFLFNCNTFISFTYYKTVNNIYGGFNMSDTNCGCGCDSYENRMSTRENCGCGCNSTFGFGNNNSCLWIILLLIFCGGCGNNGCGSNYGYNNGCGNDSCLWIILLLIFCGGCGNNY